MATSSSDIHYLGIRHHGPGSAGRLLQALDKLQPDCVLIEGPADCNELLPFLIDKEMQPPVALLGYIADSPEQHIYYPFTDYSPEYQACLWAIKQKAVLAFIDLPMSIKLSSYLQSQQETKEQPSENEDDTIKNRRNIASDPIGILAKISGYQDGESWWNDFIEQNYSNNEDSLILFQAIGTVITALREDNKGKTNDDFVEQDEVREAFMRLQIANYQKELIKKLQDKNKKPVIVVVCGAWHVPALQANIKQKEDKELIKQLPKKLHSSKLKRTWIPWTSTRLSKESGYGAGVSSPMWYQHLWSYRNCPEQLIYWIRHVAEQLRKEGQIISTASIIETVRLSHSLAVVRGRSTVGFEEIIDATISCLCFGESLIWQQIAPKILLGNKVGHIPNHMPLAPLLEDLQYQQKITRLNPEISNHNLSLDLRSEFGNKRSVLLHRLQILNVPWGELLDSGNYKGTFREKWSLDWKPEYSVQLIENLTYGNSIEQASNNKLIATLQQNLSVDELAKQVQLALTAQLNEATHFGLQYLNQQAIHNSDILSLLKAIVPLIEIRRYGTARNIDLMQVQNLIEKLVIQISLGLSYACRNVNEEEANQLRQHIKECHHSILLAELPNDIVENWWQALLELSRQTNNNIINAPLLSGLSTQLLYQAQKIGAKELQSRLQRILSPAIKKIDAATYFDGFFNGIIQQLQYNQLLLNILEEWLLNLSEDDFVQYLPLFKRVFADLDRNERQHLLQKIMKKKQQVNIQYRSRNSLFPLWQQQQIVFEQLFIGKNHD